MNTSRTPSADEIGYLASQRLGRLATVDPAGDPKVNPVSVHYNPLTQTLHIGGHDMAKSRKYRNVRANARAAGVVDEMPPTDPLVVRCLEIRGSAEAIDSRGDGAAGVPGPIIRIHPMRIISWGIGTPG